MKLRILAVGKLKEEYLRAGAEDYAARIRPYAQLELVEVPGLPDPVRATSAAIIKVQTAEGSALLHRVTPGEVLIALDPRGQALTSEGLAEMLAAHESLGSRLAFAVGGALGLSRDVLSRAVSSLSLSAMTFPHGLARLILLEQLYRAFKINRGEPYHK